MAGSVISAPASRRCSFGVDVMPMGISSLVLFAPTAKEREFRETFADTLARLADAAFRIWK